MTRKTFEKLAICILIFGLQVAAGLWLHRLEHSSVDGIAPRPLRTVHIGDPDLHWCEPGKVESDCVWSMQHESTGGGGTFVSEPPAPRTSNIFDLAPTYNAARDCDGLVWERTSVGWVHWEGDGIGALTQERPECGPPRWSR